MDKGKDVIAARQVRDVQRLESGRNKFNTDKPTSTSQDFWDKLSDQDRIKHINLIEQTDAFIDAQDRELGFLVDDTNS